MKKTISFLASSLLVGTGVLAQRLRLNVLSAGGGSARTASMTRPYFTQSGLFFLLLIALVAGHTKMAKASVPIIVPPTTSKPTSADCVAPVYARGGITSVCVNETVVLYTDITRNSHTWIAPAGATLDSYTNAQVTASFTTSGPKTFTVTPQNYCNNTITITVKPTPAAPTLTGVSRRVDQSNTPLPLSQFVNAETGNMLSFSGTSGMLADPPTTNISQVGSQRFSVTQTNAIGCVSGVTAFTLTVSEPPSPIRYVRAGATGSGNSWADASGDLQSQINFTGAQQVWVATGTYKPGGNANTDIHISFAMKDGVSILGGFPTTGSPTLIERNPTSLTTVLSGDIGEVGDGTPSIGNLSDNSYHVINNSGLTKTAVLDGFVIRDGYASYYGLSESQGGGMYNDNSSPTLTNCRFVANRALYGGAMYNDNSSPNLTNCSFMTNTGRFGGGMSNTGGSPTLTNCRFMNNTSSAVGGGMRNIASSPTLINCRFVDNTAGASGSGGGMYNNDSSPTLTNCSFVGNSAGYGGGILIFGNSSTLTNCSFLGNSAKVYGGAMYNYSSPVLTNCVLFSNGGASTFYTNNNSRVTATYSLFEDGVTDYDGENNLTTTVSPFVNTTDARLNFCSSAINTGTNVANTITTDLDGNPRFVNTTIDRGAYEFQGQPSFPTAITQQPPSGSLVCQGSTVSIPLSVSGTGSFTYQLITATGTPVGPSQSTTPLTLTNVQPAQSGSYSVIVTGSCNSVTSTAFILTVNATPVATLTASPSGVLSCARTSLTLTAGGGTSYTFSGPGVVSQNGNQAVVNTPGTYSVSVTNAGCTITTSITISQDNSQPTVNITPTTATLTCGVPTATLTATTAANSLTWSTGQTTSSISVSVAGTYSVTVTSANGCMAMAQATVSGTTNAPVAPTLSANPVTPTTNQPITVTANGCAGGTINWTAQGGIGQVSGNTYTLTQPGNYTISATCNLNGCSSVASAPLSVQIRPGGFAITGVSMVNCQLIDEAKGGYQVQFTPQYAGQTNSPISFAVVNELAQTTAPAPYSLRLYTDNPVITLVATQAGSGEARFAYNWLASCQSGTSPNQPPTTTGIPSQTILVGQGYQLQLTTYFADPDGQALTFQASGLPTGLTLNGSVIGGTPSQTGVSTVNVTALDPGGLQVNTSFQLTVSPMPVTPPLGFAIVGVSTVSCQVISAGERQVTFTPQYAGVSGAPISFSVVNEKLPTTDPGPYSLNLYTDNPTITLSAQQGATVSTYRYNWLAVCTPAARVGTGEASSRLRVRVLGNPVAGKTADVEIRGVPGQPVQINLVDLQGKPIHAQRIEQAGEVERVSLPLGDSNGVLLLQVSTPTQSHQLKLLRTN